MDPNDYDPNDYNPNDYDPNDYNPNDYDTHNKNITKESLDSVMKKMMVSRGDEDTKFQNMAHSDYGSAMDDKYGISKQLGFMVGTDKFGHQKNIKKRDASEEITKAYKALTDK